MDKSLKAYLRLLKTDGLGTVMAKKLLDSFEHVTDIFAEENHSILKNIIPNKSLLDRLLNPTEDDLKLVNNEMAFMQNNGIEYLGYLEPDFPNALKQIDDAPYFLFYKGNIKTKSTKALGIVGTRKATNYGLQFTQQFLKDIQNYQPIIISGLALGIDIKAHLSALENNLATIAVLGTSFSNIYPKQHEKYVPQIVENGLLVSEIPTWAKSVPELFIRRNRIIAAWSDAVVVIQSAKKGGSLSTAMYAIQYNKDVYAVPGRIDDIQSLGCMWLIQNHQAQLILNAQDVIEDMNWNETEKSRPITTENSKKTLDISKFSGIEKDIVSLLQKESPMQIDEMMLVTQLDMAKLNSTLMLLELQGVVKSFPGKMFGLSD